MMRSPSPASLNRRPIEPACSRIATSSWRVSLHRSPGNHHVVLLDINLSDGNGNGMEVLRVVAAEHPKTKVIVVSNCSDPTHRRYFAKAGAYAFFDKSHELAAMRRMLASLAGFGSPAGLS